MKVTVLQSNFAKALNHVSRIVGTRASLPVLNNALISAKNGKIEMSATNLEVGISTQIIGSVDEDGELTLPVRLLSDFILNNKDESITLKTNQSSAKLKSEHFEATIQGISSEEFPTVPKPPTEIVAKISRTKLIDALKKVNIAGANDETRPVLAGIYFQFKGDQLVLAATDSYRLAEKKIKLDTEVKEQNIIVPLRTTTEVLRVLLSEDSVDDIKLSAKENQIAFRIGDTYIVSRLIEGSFPNYDQIIPTGFKTIAKIKQSEFLSAVKMTSLFARDSANNNIKISTNKDSVSISSVASEVGSSKSTVEAEINGDNTEIAFNARYILDILNVVNDEKIELDFNDSTTAGAVKLSTDPDFIYIVMPLLLDN